jgi:hypothetical protein
MKPEFLSPRGPRSGASSMTNGVCPSTDETRGSGRVSHASRSTQMSPLNGKPTSVVLWRMVRIDTSGYHKLAARLKIILFG